MPDHRVDAQAATAPEARGVAEPELVDQAGNFSASIASFQLEKIFFSVSYRFGKKQ